jgi:hypothetical protein
MNENKLNKFIKDYQFSLKEAGLSDLVTVNLNIFKQFHQDFNSNNCRDVTIRSIWSNIETGKGHATKALKLLIKMSNEHNVDLKFSVESLQHDAYDPKYTEKETNRLENLNESYLSDEQLLQWYSKTGFVAVATKANSDSNELFYMVHKSTFSNKVDLKGFIAEKKDDKIISNKNTINSKFK